LIFRPVSQSERARKIARGEPLVVIDGTAERISPEVD
jgi:hypothetical protein